MGMMLERFEENKRKIMVLKPCDETSLPTAFEQSVFFAKKHHCDEYRLQLPNKTLTFGHDVTEEALEKDFKRLTQEDYRNLEHNIVPFSREGWSNEDEEELHSFLFDLALLTKNIPWANELYNKTLI